MRLSTITTNTTATCRGFVGSCRCVIGAPATSSRTACCVSPCCRSATTRSTTTTRTISPPLRESMNLKTCAFVVSFSVAVSTEFVRIVHKFRFTSCIGSNFKSHDIITVLLN
ncbi:hypothetical protein MtrunA17_Chr1g0179961 [Medicago truncatula]|uniref:Uncharacterized protein n=1 Tax=Medicago truncatula TaxID=3880 RepID=A0A396JN08_MEDTR|nr:hypothetical protein MtrunA17_Chr1g0179961 [Medicago truncatula]